MEWFFDTVGLIGVACFLGAYFLLQAERLAAADLLYLALNLLGALLIMVSLTHKWNPSAFLLEAAWAAITLYGMFKTLRRRAQKRRAGAGDDR